MTIGIASDHKGFLLKRDLVKYLSENGYNVVDYGTDNEASTDYPIYAFKIGEEVVSSKISLGILICGTGIGMSIACNKVKGIRCAKVDTIEEAYLARQHNNANVIAIAYNTFNAKGIIEAFLTTAFSNEERHIKRNAMIDNYDN